MESKELIQSCLHTKAYQSLSFCLQPFGKSMGGGGDDPPPPLLG